MPAGTVVAGPLMRRALRRAVQRAARPAQAQEARRHAQDAVEIERAHRGLLADGLPDGAELLELRRDLKAVLEVAAYADKTGVKSEAGTVPPADLTPVLLCSYKTIKP